MFGLWRYFLSICVIVAHVAPLDWSWGSSRFLGVYAVFAFYILSGYLITRVLHERYGYALDGFARFHLNRILRLYPAYWAAAIVALAVVLLFQQQASRTAGGYALPSSATDWFSALVIVGTRLEHSKGVLIPQAWTLSVELLYYLLMSIGLSRTRYLGMTWLILSAASTVYIILVERMDF